MGLVQETVSLEAEGRKASVEEIASSGLCWPGFAFDRAKVRDLGVPAYNWTLDGELWEFEDGAFTVTARGERHRMDEADAPIDGWSHPEDCACPACRVARR
jgi:hypothetical protein